MLPGRTVLDVGIIAGWILAVVPEIRIEIRRRRRTLLLLDVFGRRRLYHNGSGLYNDRRCIRLPISRIENPFAADQHPAGGNETIAWAFGFPMAAEPDVRAAVPAPISGRPHVTRTRRRNTFDAGRRWTYAYMDTNRSWLRVCSLHTCSKNGQADDASDFV